MQKSQCIKKIFWGRYRKLVCFLTVYRKLFHIHVHLCTQTRSVAKPSELPSKVASELKRTLISERFGAVYKESNSTAQFDAKRTPAETSLRWLAGLPAWPSWTFWMVLEGVWAFGKH